MDTFNTNLDPTIGAAFMARNMLHNGINFKFQVLYLLRFGILLVKKNIIL